MEQRSFKVQNIIWTLLLTLYPMVGINQGLSVVDTTYSLSNFAFFPEMKGTWAVATYLANALGYGLMHLPFGDTMLGMNFYTRIVIVVMALASYHTLKKSFPMWLVALAELAAIGLCWAPSTTLYHYLTYMFIQLASLCLFRAFTAPEGIRKKWFITAGVFLGVNVGVRMPNVTHAALILAVWYGTYLTCENRGAIRGSIWKNTLWCLLGYLPGLLVPLAAICMQFGVNAYPDMIRTLFAMTEKAQDYKPGAMVTGIFGGYLEGLTWIGLLAACVVAGSAAAVILNKALLRRSGNTEGGGSVADNKKAHVIFALAYMAALFVLFRFYWGRGMFDLRYYNYGAVYNLTVLFLWIALAVFLYALLRRGLQPEFKILAAISLLQMFLVPLGGNNGLYPVMNQMFLVLPAALGLFLYLTLPEKSQNVSRDALPAESADAVSISGGRSALGCFTAFPVRAAVFLTAAVLFVQSVGFHACFAIQDGVWGDARSATVDNNVRIAGIRTTEQNGQMLKELSAFAAEQGLEGKKAILYGEIPGLGYILHMPSALTTFWPDLDSYRVGECRRDLREIDGRITLKGMERPVVIVSAGIAAWMDDDGQAMQWFGADADALQKDEKLGMIRQLLCDHAYAQTFCNASFAVYQ